MTTLFYKLPKNIADSFRGKNLWWHFLAIILTLLLVLSGFDWFYYTVTRNDILLAALFPAVILGGLVPMFGPLLLLLIGRLKKNFRFTNTGWATGQAALLGLGMSFLYKAFTGRAHPHFTGTMTDITREFHFGFLQGGVFWGWPSSHTTVAFAVAFALIVLFPKNKLIVFLSLLYAFYVGIGVSMTIHWFSDFVAGAILGTVVGKTVGRSFAGRLRERESL